MKYQLIYHLHDQEGEINETIERDNLNQVKYYTSKLNFVAAVKIWDYENDKCIYFKRNMRTIRKK